MPACRCTAAAPAYRVETWGCQMNVLDGSAWPASSRPSACVAAAEGEAAGRGPPEHVRGPREGRSEGLQRARRARAAQAGEPRPRRRRDGCVAQVSGEEILERAPWVDFVAGTGQVEKIGEIVAAARRSGARRSPWSCPRRIPVYQFRQISRESCFQAYVTVIEGCDQFCTFCIVPFTRGRERSRRAAEILEELAHLASPGLHGGHAARPDRQRLPGSGGRLRPGRAAAPRRPRVEGLRRAALPDLASALRGRRPRRGARRGRPDRALPAPARPVGLGPHPAPDEAPLHGRGVPRRRSRGSARACPDIALSSDFIVGFPGETEEDFEETLALVRRVRFGSLFGFRYSPRPGTASARWGSETEVPDDGRRRAPGAPARPPDRDPARDQPRASSAGSSRSWSRARTGKGQSHGPDLLQPDRPRGGPEAHAAAGPVRPRPDHARASQFTDRKALGVGNPGEAR